jgi:hypothetical protein
MAILFNTLTICKMREYFALGHIQIVRGKPSIMPSSGARLQVVESEDCNISMLSYGSFECVGVCVCVREKQTQIVCVCVYPEQESKRDSVCVFV